MGNWFSKENRGSVFGFWSANASAGNIIGSQFAGFMLSADFSWEFIMLIAVIGLFVSMLIFVIFIPEKPDPSLISLENSSMLDVQTIQQSEQQSITFIDAWRIPG
jgi:OPA family glycerol-3-phosphate transporter-like MFS transporter 3